ncbi:YicC family protein [Cognatishimia sp. SS12]|uniref:YicC/YloC family endoribonuclease n=1 Tax=Cognatishimia sp. SS12 TaxID=2979465 RepID=UPI00232C46AB|nr:YicC/YloC family endoribonuclease [Cognatishimia sp. SS12]MDC0737290.1 YicC family protein [Cognatishimia sp. SS12]
MLRSMTGFAASKGSHQDYNWLCELRSVNAKGLDLRLRVPDWIEGLEPELRARLSKAIVRGSVALNLRVSRTESSAAPQLNAAALDGALAALLQIETRAMDEGLSLAPCNAADILSLRGVMDVAQSDADTAPLRTAILTEIPALIDSFTDMRAKEGAALETVLAEQIAAIAALTDQAAKVAEARKDEMAATLRSNLQTLIDNTEGQSEQRLAQELAVLVVKADVTEEIDRLRAHVAAARDLMAQGSPIGRKLDFLMQEFNREANTLCSKAQNIALTQVGLDLKAAIEQMREQVQNVE